MRRIAVASTEKTNLTKFYEGMAPLYIICRLSGIFPLAARRSKSNIILTLRRNDYYYFVSYFLIYVSLSVYATYNVLLDEDNYVIVPKILVLSETLIVIILMLITMFFCFFFRRLLLDCARLITDVDCTLQSLRVLINYRAAMWSNLKVFGIMIVSVFVRSIIMGSTLQIDFVQQFTLFSTTFIKSLSKYEFIAVLLPLSVRFNKINKQILSYRVRRRDPTLPGNLYTLCRTHFKLCNISRRLNVCFAFQLLCSLAVSLTDILFQGFYLYVIMTKKQSIATPCMMASPVVWLIDEWMEIYLLVNACSATCQAANASGMVLHELRNSLQEHDIDQYIQMFSLQMLHQKLEFSALGFFTIDFSLLYSIVGAVTTYLVIFIQFDQSNDTKNSNYNNCTTH